ncbi:MAG TPA: hypothetical protein VKT28_22380 [Puia sp.]|nr:hypothetical protein [Puia sp.]
MKTFMRIALIGLLAISSTAYAGGGKHKAKAKAQQQCPSNCDKSVCKKKTCPEGQADCAKMHCIKKS